MLSGSMADREPKLDPPIRAVIDATNQADPKAFAAAFAKDGTVNDWGELHAGRGEIGKWDRAENSGRATKLRVTGVSRLGSEVLVLLEVTRDNETSSATWSFQLKGNAVASLEIG